MADQQTAEQANDRPTPREVRAFREVRLVKDEDGKEKIRGYAAVFDKPSEVLQGPDGPFVEYVRKGAFARALKARADVKALVDHDSSRILGRNTAGTLEMMEDDRGLRIVIDPPDTTTGRDTVESLRRGDLDAMSFAFAVHGVDGSSVKWGDKGEPDIRTLLDVDLYDISVVTYPAYPDTTVAVRSMKQARQQADETIEGEEREAEVEAQHEEGAEADRLLAERNAANDLRFDNAKNARKLAAAKAVMDRINARLNADAE